MSKTYRHTYLEQIVDIINDLPSAQQWIPCSERMPDKTGAYLVTEKTGSEIEIKLINFSSDLIRWVNFGDEVLAWMPLPEPWEGEKNDKRKTHNGNV